MQQTTKDKLASINEQLVIVKNDNAYTTSRKVAEIFGKNHQHVLRDIQKLKSKCSSEFWLSNFGLSYFSQKMPRGGGSKRQPEFNLSKNGFIMLAMGFTGDKAIRFKEAYINAFDKMQEVITKRLYGEGVTLTEVRKHVTCNFSENLFVQDKSYIYVLSEFLKYLGYKNMNQESRMRYGHVLTKIDGVLWAKEEFVKMKIRSRSALNARKAVLQECLRIEEGRKQEALIMKEFRKKHNL